VPWRTVAVGSALLAVLAAGSTAVLLDGRPDPSLPVAPVAADRAPAPAGAAGSVGGFAPKALPLASATDFDPYGRDGVENPDLVPLAIDGDPATAWLTVSYKNSDMRPKAGTGLLIDLGIARPISEVRLQLAGTGTDVELRYGDTLARTERGFELLAAAVGAGGAIAIRTPAPVQTRYLLIWLKNLPYTDGAYQGGVREVRLLG
jgi:putative peptidoglycan lipid II flippase